MNIIDYSNFEQVFFVGSINGDLNKIIENRNEDKMQKIRRAFKSSKKSNDDQIKNSVLIISTGPLKINTDDKEKVISSLKEANETLQKNGITLLSIRGNGDNPFFFNEEPINLSNLRTIPDYTIIKINNHNILAIGGGFSVDKNWKIKQQERLNSIKENLGKKLYWEGETPFYNEKALDEIVSNGVEIDTVLTNLPPSMINTNISKNKWLKCDDSLNTEYKNCRLIFDRVNLFLNLNNCKISKWFCSGNGNANYVNLTDTNFKSISDRGDRILFHAENQENNEYHFNDIPSMKINWDLHDAEDLAERFADAQRQMGELNFDFEIAGR